MRSILRKLRYILNRPVGYGTGFSILIGTMLMTLLFWKAQSLEVVSHADMISALSELKYFDARLDRHLAVASQYGELNYNAITVDNYALWALVNSIATIKSESQAQSNNINMEMPGFLQTHLSQKLQFIDESKQFKKQKDSLFVQWGEDLVNENSPFKRKAIKAKINDLSFIVQSSAKDLANSEIDYDVS